MSSHLMCDLLQPTESEELEGKIETDNDGKVLGKVLLSGGFTCRINVRRHDFFSQILSSFNSLGFCLLDKMICGEELWTP